MSADGLGFTAYHHVGADLPVVVATPSPVLQLVGDAAIGLAAYHGYKRHRGSVGWALGWALLAGLAPVIVTGVALAQGLGKPKGG